MVSGLRLEINAVDRSRLKSDQNIIFPQQLGWVAVLVAELSKAGEAVNSYRLQGEVLAEQQSW